jgi:hypothetical protein
MTTIFKGLSESEIVRFFSCRFQGWEYSNGHGSSKQPRWCADSELERSIRVWLSSNPQKDAEAFARYCLTNLGNGSFEFASRHLSAFLEHISYDIAKKVFKKLKETQSNNYSSILPVDQSLDEIYQYGWLVASNPAEFFCKFKFEAPSLVNYTRVKMKGVINDGVFARHNTNISNYGLLRKLGPNQRNKALQAQGYRNTLLSQYCLAWECFNQTCVSRGGRISPTNEDWQAITRQYNKLSRQLPNSQGSSNINITTIKNWLNDICVPAARNFLFLQLTSTDIMNPDNALIIELPDTSPSPSGILEQLEVNEIVTSFTTNFSFSVKLVTLDTEQKKVLILRYGLQLTQIEVAQEMSWLDKNNRPINYKVSRCEDRIIVKLLKEIATWVMQEQAQNQFPWFLDNFHDNINLNWLGEIKPVMEVLLIRHCSALVNSWLDTALLPIQVINQQITQLLSLKQGNERLLLFVQRVFELEEYKILTTYLLNRHQYIFEQIQTYFNVTLQPGDTVAERIMFLVLEHLKTHSA